MRIHRKSASTLAFAIVLTLGSLTMAYRLPGTGNIEGEFAQGPEPLAKLAVTSPAFVEGGSLPPEFTCDGASASPPVAWSGAPEGTKCYALEVWHIPGPGDVKSYWVVYNIPASVTRIAKNEKTVGVAGLNDKRRTGYDPMCSKGPGAKKYNITVHALSAEIPESSRKLNRAELLKAIKEIELARGTLSFTYARQNRG